MLARDLVSLLAVIFVTFIFVATMETYCYLVEGLGKTQHYEEIDEILSTYNFDYFIFNNLKDLTTEQIFFVNNVSNQEFITLSENISEISNDIQFIKCDYDNKIDKKIFVQQSGLTLFTTVFRKTIYETISVDTNSAYGDLLQILDRTTPYFEEIITASDIYFILFDENNNSLQFGPKITESNFSFIAQLASTLPTLHIAIYIDNEFAIDKFKEIASQRSIICAAQNGGMIKIQDDDGNCFLRAIAYLLFGDAKFHYLIRYEMIVVYLYKYKQLLKLVDNENIIRSKIPVSFTNNHLSTKQCLIDYGNNITPLGRWTGSYIDAFVVGHLYGINIGNYTFSRFAGGGQGALLYECLKMDDKLDDKYTEICLLVTATSQYHKWRYRNFVHYDAFEKEPIVWSPPITAINSHSILNKYKNNPPLIFSPSPYYILLLNACCVCGKQTVHNCQFPNCDIIICNECGGWPEHPSLLFCPRHSQSHGKSYIESLDKDDSKSISESLQLFGASDDAVFGIESLGRDDNKIISESLQLFGASDDAVFGIESLGRDDNKIISESLQLFGASDDAVIGIESLDKDDNKIIYESIQLFGDEVADEEPKSESPNGCCVCGKQSVHNCQFANCYINICNECGGWPEHPSLLFCPRHSQSHGKSCIESLDKDDSKSISESLQLFGASDDAVIGNEVADEESKSEPEKIPIKQNEFNFGFKVDLWAKLEKAGDGAIDDNSILDPILWDEFVADYPHFIENKTDKKFSSKGIRYLRRKVRKWSAAKKKKTTQLNYLTIGKNGKRNAGAVMTLTGNFKCLPREYLSLAVKNGMKNVTTNKTYLKTYKQYSSYLGYTASLSDLDDGKDTFMRHAVKSMHQDVVKEHRCLDRLKKNPLKCKSLEIKKLKSIPGRKVSDIGKITTRYSEKELPAIKAIFDIKDKNENQIKNIFGDLLILAKKASVHSFEQIIKESNLIDNYDDTKLPFRTKWDILNLTDNYNYLGLFNFMKSPTDTQNECIEPPSFIMKYSAEESQEETKKSIQKKKKKRGSSFNTPSKKEIVREQK
eukprot:87428_1